LETTLQEFATSYSDQLGIVRAISVLYHIEVTHVRFHDSMTLGHVYDLDLKKNEGVIKDVIIQAQGEVCKARSFVNTL
jgi:sporulation protein YlmC with PRC-barrel domain